MPVSLKRLCSLQSSIGDYWKIVARFKRSTSLPPPSRARFFAESLNTNNGSFTTRPPIHSPVRWGWIDEPTTRDGNARRPAEERKPRGTAAQTLNGTARHPSVHLTDFLYTDGHRIFGNSICTHARFAVNLEFDEWTCDVTLLPRTTIYESVSFPEISTSWSSQIQHHAWLRDKSIGRVSSIWSFAVHARFPRAPSPLSHYSCR